MYRQICLEEQKELWFVINFHDIQSKPVVDSFAVDTKILTPGETFVELNHLLNFFTYPFGTVH